MLPYNASLKLRARVLRKGMTDAENLVWSRVRGKQLLAIQFYRQKTIGEYSVDFYAPKANLVVEIDGSQHLESGHARNDRMRDAYLKRQGLTVPRFDNLQVLKETEAVVEVVFRAIESTLMPPRLLSPQPLFLKGGQQQLNAQAQTAVSKEQQARSPESGTPHKNAGVRKPLFDGVRNPPLKKGGRGDLRGAKARDEGVS